MVERVLLPVIATIVAFAMVIAAFLTAFFLFFSAARAPCVDQASILVWLRLLIPLVLSFTALWLGFLKGRPGIRAFLIVVAIPALALSLDWQQARWNADSQQKCERQTLEQAVAACHANLSVYRAGRDQYGYRTLTLVAPGYTDQAWSCLERWADHNGSASLKIDESVYEQARAK